MATLSVQAHYSKGFVVTLLVHLSKLCNHSVNCLQMDNFLIQYHELIASCNFVLLHLLVLYYVMVFLQLKLVQYQQWMIMIHCWIYIHGGNLPFGPYLQDYIIILYTLYYMFESCHVLSIESVFTFPFMFLDQILYLLVISLTVISLLWQKTGHMHRFTLIT